MKRFFNIFSLLILALVFNVASMYAEPSSQAKYISISDVTSNSAKLTWINGNGGKRIVVVYSNNSYTAPTDGVDYNANANWGTGSVLGSGYVVYDGSGSTRTVTVTGLTTGTTYYVKVYEYNDVPNDFDYNVNSATNNPRSFSTSIATPTGLNTTNIGFNTATVNWNTVNGALGYLLTVNGTDYDETDIGNFTSFDLTNLTHNSTYTWTVAAYSANYDLSDYANTVQFTTPLDNTPPTFTVSYYADNNYTTPLTMIDGTVGEGTYYMMVTSSEPLSNTPTLTIATLGEDNDRVLTQSTKQISDYTFAFTRQVVGDIADDGSANEVVSITGTDLNGITTNNQQVNGFKIDTKPTEVESVSRVNNYEWYVEFTEITKKDGAMGNLTTDNFTATLNNATGSGISEVNIESVTTQDGITYQLILSYTGTDVFGGAPYEASTNPSVSIEVVDAEDRFDNEYVEGEGYSLDLDITPVRITDVPSYNNAHSYFMTLADAMDAADDYQEVYFAPTSIEIYDAVNVTKAVTFTAGVAGATLFLDAPWTITNAAEFSSFNGNLNISQLEGAANTAVITSSTATLTVTGISVSSFAAGTAFNILAGDANFDDVAFGDNIGDINVTNASSFTVYNSSFDNTTNSIVVANAADVLLDNNDFSNVTNAINITNASATAYLIGVDFTNVTNAITIGNTPEFYVSDCEFTNITNGVVLANTFTGIADVFTNSFNSGTNAITNNSAVVVNAVSNYYNSPNGPTHADNPCGNGLTVSDNVDYEPWYYDNSLTTTASNVTGYSIAVDNGFAEYCAYEGNETNISSNDVIEGGYNNEYTFQWYIDGAPIDGATDENLVGYELDVAGTYTFKREVTSNNCTYTSNEVEVIVNPLPNEPILTAPNGGNFCFDDSIIMSVSNEQVDATEVTYEWFNVNDVNNSVGSGTELEVFEDGEYFVVATNMFGCMTQSENITVDELPEITIEVNGNDADYVACVDLVSPLTTTVGMYNTEDYTYQWYKDNVAIVGADEPTYEANEIGTFIYKVVATNISLTPNCVTEDEIEVTINPLPTKPEISGDLTVCFGESNILTVSNYTMLDLQNYSLTWFDSNDNVVETGLTLEVSNTETYYVVATNLTTGCDIESENVEVVELDQFTVSVADQSYCSNVEPLTLTADIVDNGTNTYSYQWYLNGEEVVGATESTYTRTNMTPGTYTYSVEITLTTNDEGCIQWSNDATVTIFELAEPTVDGTNLVCENQTISLSSTNENSNATVASYQWYHNGDELVGENNATLEITNAQLSAEGNYTVEMTTDNGCVTESANFYVEMSELAEITSFKYTNNLLTNENILADNQETSFREDLTITYNVTADSAMTYVWYFNGEEIEGENSNSLTLDTADVRNLWNTLGNKYDGTFYTTDFTIQVEATSANSCESDFSYTAILNVIPVPTKLVISEILDDANNRKETNDAFDVEIKTYNDYNVLAAVVSDTKIKLNRIADLTVNYSVNSVTSGGSYNAADTSITMSANSNTLVVSVTMVKAIGAIDNQLATATHHTNTGMTLANDTSNTFVLVPALPASPTNFRRTARSKTTITMAWNIATSTHNSLLVVKQEAGLNNYSDETPEDGYTYSSTLGRSVQNFANGTNDNDLDGNIGNGGYRAIYFGNARTILIQGLTNNTEYNAKVYAVAGDFSNTNREATIRYSLDVVGQPSNNTALYQKTMAKETADDFVEYGNGEEAPFTVDAVYPNPVRDEVNFTINSANAATYKVEIMSANGQIVSVPFSELVLAAGSHSHNFRIEGLAAGSYMLMFTSGEFATVIPIVVMP